MEQTGDTVSQLNTLFHIKGALELLKKFIQFPIFIADVVAPLVGDLGGVPHLIKIGIKGA